MAIFEGDVEPMPPDGMVTVARFEDPLEAQMAKGMLESAGVECWMIGLNVNNLLGAAFRVRLQVKVEDEATALELLPCSASTAASNESTRELN